MSCVYCQAGNANASASDASSKLSMHHAHLICMMVADLLLVAFQAD